MIVRGSSLTKVDSRPDYTSTGPARDCQCSPMVLLGVRTCRSCRNIGRWASSSFVPFVIITAPCQRWWLFALCDDWWNSRWTYVMSDPVWQCQHLCRVPMCTAMGTIPSTAGFDGEILRWTEWLAVEHKSVIDLCAAPVVGSRRWVMVARWVWHRTHPVR